MNAQNHILDIYSEREDTYIGEEAFLQSFHLRLGTMQDHLVNIEERLASTDKELVGGIVQGILRPLGFDEEEWEPSMIC